MPILTMRLKVLTATYKKRHPGISMVREEQLQQQQGECKYVSLFQTLWYNHTMQNGPPLIRTKSCNCFGPGKAHNLTVWPAECIDDVPPRAHLIGVAEAQALAHGRGSNLSLPHGLDCCGRALWQKLGQVQRLWGGPFGPHGLKCKQKQRELGAHM
eukprot:1152881-Pelagomonas_calceolata.AAC.1